MSIGRSSARLSRASGVALCLLFLGSGCWWQKDAYTKAMTDGVKSFEKRAQRERLLGPSFDPAGDFQMWFRPPLPTTLVATPEAVADQFVVWFQGSEPSGPLIQVLIKGSAGTETLAEFQANAYNSLKAASKFPPQDPEKVQDPQTIYSMHDNSLMTFELYHVIGNHSIPPTPGAAPTAVSCHWLIYFAEDQTQKIMVCYIIPDSKYIPESDLLAAMTMSLESLALASKVPIARQSGAGGTPAGG